MTTRANVESIIVARLGPLMTKAGMTITTAGANASLNDPIGWGIRQSGYTVASLALVTNVDVAGVATADLDTFLDYVEYRTLLNIMTNITMVDVKIGSRSEALSQLAEQIQKRLDWLGGLLGLGVGELTTGLLYFDFAEHGGDAATDEE